MKAKIRLRFTLIELLAATFVLSMLVLGLLQIFSVTQKLMSSASSKIEMCSRAKLALDTIATDIECLYYKEGVAALCIKEEKQNEDKFKGSVLSLGTKRAAPVAKTDDLNALCGSNITAVNYRLYDGTLKSFAVANDDSSGLCKVDESAVLDYNGVEYPSPVKLATFDDLEDEHKDELKNTAKLEAPVIKASRSVDIIEGVKDFNVIFMTWHVDESKTPKVYELIDMSSDEQKAIYEGSAYHKDDPSNPGQMRVPDAVRIELELYDQDIVAAERNKDRGVNPGVDIDAMKDSSVHCQKFIRIVSINREQRNLASQKMEVKSNE